jgi:hypothetical protein
MRVIRRLSTIRVTRQLSTIRVTRRVSTMRVIRRLSTIRAHIVDTRRVTRIIDTGRVTRIVDSRRVTRIVDSRRVTRIVDTRRVSRIGFLCCVFCFLLVVVLCHVLNVACIYGLSSLTCPFGFILRLFTYKSPSTPIRCNDDKQKTKNTTQKTKEMINKNTI